MRAGVFSTVRVLSISAENISILVLDDTDAKTKFPLVKVQGHTE